jgi:hypothetical protein
MDNCQSKEARMSHLMFQLRGVRAGVQQLLDDIGSAMTVDVSPVTVHTRDAANDTPLHYAAYWGDVRAIDMLAAAGAALDAHGAFDATPLLCAIFNGHHAAARLLVDLGASPGEQTALGTAVEAAARSNDLRIRALFGHVRLNPSRVAPLTVLGAVCRRMATFSRPTRKAVRNVLSLLWRAQIWFTCTQRGAAKMAARNGSRTTGVNNGIGNECCSQRAG